MAPLGLLQGFHKLHLRAYFSRLARNVANDGVVVYVGACVDFAHGPTIAIDSDVAAAEFHSVEKGVTRYS